MIGLEPLGDQSATLCLKHYLTEVPFAVHRHALMRLLSAEHPFGSEHLQRNHRYRAILPYHLLLCRFCLHRVETPEHHLLQCFSSLDLRIIRTSFFADYALSPLALSVNGSRSFDACQESGFPIAVPFAVWCALSPRSLRKTPPARVCSD